jgi:hypothetical protein
VAPSKADVAPNGCGYGAKQIATHCHFEPFQGLNGHDNRHPTLGPFAVLVPHKIQFTDVIAKGHFFSLIRFVAAPPSLARRFLTRAIT